MFRGLQNRPRLLEGLYGATERAFFAASGLIERLGFERVGRWIEPAETLAKDALFDCQVCGQCILHSTGMTCPMTCPKNLRNGPCGGVRANGHCEVKPEMRCVWVEAFERAQRMPTYGDELAWIQPPVNRQLEGTSAWVNMLTGVDKQAQPGWAALADDPNTGALRISLPVIQSQR